MARKYTTTSAKFDKQLWIELKRVNPEITAHGKSHAIEILFCREIGIKPPLAPIKRQIAGAITRGNKLRGQPAINQGSRKKKGA